MPRATSCPGADTGRGARGLPDGRAVDRARRSGRAVERPELCRAARSGRVPASASRSRRGSYAHSVRPGCRAGRGPRSATGRPPGSPASGVATPPRARRRDPRCPPPRPARPSSCGGVAHATVTLTGTNPPPPCAETCAASSPDGSAASSPDGSATSSPDGSATSARPARAGINPGDSARGGLAHTRWNSSHGLRTGTAAEMWSTSYRPDRFAGVSQVVRG